jgi:hypothetical protein
MIMAGPLGIGTRAAWRAVRSLVRLWAVSIPATLFQTWKSKTDVPANMRYWSGTFATHNPEFERRLWDDEDNRRFIAERFPWFLPSYDAYPAEIYRADAVRYFFLYVHGGVYADMDTECLRPLRPLLEGAPVQLGYMGGDPDFVQGLPNAVMLSAPRQSFWLLVMSLLTTASTDRGPEATTGPALLRTAYRLYAQRHATPEVDERLADVRGRLSPELRDAYDGHVHVHPPRVFHPLDWSDRVHSVFVREPLIQSGRVLDARSAAELFPGSYTVGYWVHSWGPPTERTAS